MRGVGYAPRTLGPSPRCSIGLPRAPLRLPVLAPRCNAPLRVPHRHPTRTAAFAQPSGSGGEAAASQTEKQEPASSSVEGASGSTVAAPGTPAARERSGAAALATASAWGEARVSGDDDLPGARALTLKDVDWGMAGLFGGILLLSFGAYRLLDAWGVYRHAHAGSSGMAQVLVDTRGDRGREQQHRVRRDASAQQQEGAAAAEAAPQEQEQETGKKQQRGSKSKKQQQQEKQQQEKERERAAAEAVAGLAKGSLQGVPGAPQPSPLDKGFSAVEAPWAGRDLGDLSLAPLAALPAAAARGAPHAQAELRAKAVDASALDGLTPDDVTVPGLRQRSHLAMRAAAAAMEASQRAVAYSAAASSAAARATEAAEAAAAAASDVQVALEAAAEDAMAEAVARMNRAVEMVADAESRAAAAAATATAHQDVAESQAAIAHAAANVPAAKALAGVGAHGARSGGSARVHELLHAHLFTAWGVLSEAAGSAWQGLVASVGSAWAAVLGALAAAAAAVAGALRLGRAAPPPTAPGA